MSILCVDDRVALSGGYNMVPAWLNGKSGHLGTVKAFIPGQNDTPAALVELDESITVEQTTGKFVVLELRYSGAQWTASNTVHVELCDFLPDSKPWQARRHGLWIESHATCSRIDERLTPERGA